MKKVDFDIGAEAQRGASISLATASDVIQKHQDILQEPGVLGMWAGARGPEPYIMLAVHYERSRPLSKAIPDSLDGVSVYYIEGELG